MPLTGTGPALGTAIWNAIKVLNTDMAKYAPAEEAAALAFWQSISSVIVAHIILNSLVPVQPGTFKTVDVTTGDELVVGVGQGNIT